MPLLTSVIGMMLFFHLLFGVSGIEVRFFKLKAMWHFSAPLGHIHAWQQYCKYLGVDVSKCVGTRKTMDDFFPVYLDVHMHTLVVRPLPAALPLYLVFD